MKKRTVLLCVIITSLSLAQEKPSSLTVQQVADHLYLAVGGAGANTGFYAGSKEVIVIDAKMTPESAKEMLAAVASVSQKPVTTVILTHSDRDHVNGLAGMPDGVRILAHANSRIDMIEASMPESRLPSLTFTDSLTLYVDNMPIKLLYFGPAHTNGDVVVFFPALRTAFVGDLLFFGRDPLIHLAKHGTSFGLVKALQSILLLDADTFVSGHASPVTKKEIRELMASIQEKQEKVRALVAEGKSLAEVKKVFGIEDAPAKPGTIQFPSLAEVIYTELSRK
jgi:glyoxylase-like metal-dependent hydrolase (beta-lactamase superfamily II)